MVSIPSLVLVALFTYANYFVTDKLLMVYFYKTVPKFNSELYESVQRTLIWGTCLIFMFGYWQLGNVQIFTQNPGELIN